MKSLSSLAVVLLMVFSNVHAKQPIAGHQAEQAFNMWLSAFNGGKREDLQAFITRYQANYKAEDDMDFRESMGTFKLLKIQTSTPVLVQAWIVSNASDNVFLAKMSLDPKDSSKVVKFEFDPSNVPEEYKPKRMEMAALLAEGKSRLQALDASGKLSGTLLVAKGGNVLLEWSGGYANRENRVAIDKSTKFRLASLNKMFTAVAILQLVEAGKLSLDDTVARHLQTYPNQTVAASITIRQLLNHTSGTGEIFTEEYAKQSASIKTLTDYWRLFSAEPLKFKPGSEDKYSNYGYILLGSIIEAASGQSYYDYVDEHIFKVAGMVSTGSEPEATLVPGRAAPYTKVDGQWKDDSASLPWRGTSAGGGYSTVGDLLNFANALAKGTVLSPKSYEAATSPQNNKAWYGYGFMVSGQGDRRQFGHEGGASGANAVFLVYPSKEYVVIGLSNFDPSTMGNIANFFGRRLPL